ncbi:MAG: DUF3848 domain-containing protein [Lachnospiraceae bacterium]|nr:DUF3848 domain-containing protein [Lachnospiraceae bacterium]
MKEHFLERIYGEYQAYKASVLSCPNAEIFDRCYEIDTIVNFYEILVEKAEGMSDNELELLLKRKRLLMELYGIWLKKSDSTFDDMKNYVDDEIRNMAGRI